MHARLLDVALGERSYPIWIGTGLLDDPALLGRALGRGAVAVISCGTVADLYLQRLAASLGDRLALVQVLPDGEAQKTLATVAKLYDALAEARIGRDGTLIALGGGVVGDITGFTAATWQRGIDFVQIPTTLLAQVDSSVGGKTGVNHARGKNLIGSFHQPRAVIADLDTLRTLPARELSAGLAEVLKYGLIGDPDFYAWVAAHGQALRQCEPEALAEAVWRSCAAKARIVAADEREGEGGRRALLNFGHTFGHALETLCGYGTLLHGEAVAIGMVLATEMSHRLGALSREEVDSLRAVLSDLGLPVEVPAGIRPQDLQRAMTGDKKTLSGQLRLVLLRRLGDAHLTAEFPQAVLQRVLEIACAPRRGAV